MWPCSSISYSNPMGSFVHVIGKKTRTDTINTVTKTINLHILPFYVPNSSISNVNSPKLKQSKAKKKKNIIIRTLTFWLITNLKSSILKRQKPGSLSSSNHPLLAAMLEFLQNEPAVGHKVTN